MGGRGGRSVASLVLILAAFLGFATQAPAALYVGGIGINRVNLDGTFFQSEFIETGSGSTCGIAVDAGHIYWADSYEETIARANLDGTGVEDAFISLPKGTHPCGLAVNSEFIYWTSGGTHTLGRARLDGSELDLSFINTEPFPCAVAVNQTGIYWSSETEDSIWRTDLAGLNGPELVIDEPEGDPCGIGIEGPHLFWVNGEGGAIGRANLDGSEAQPEFIAGVRYPISLAIQAGHLYWVSEGGEFRSIGRADLDGGEVNDDFITGHRYLYALAADSVVFSPPPPPPAPEPSRMKLGKLRRMPNGTVYLRVNLVAGGFLQAEARGLKARALPDGSVGGSDVTAGRKWLRLVPNANDPASKCVVRALRPGDRIRVKLRVVFHSPPSLPTIKKRKLFMFKPSLAPERHRRTVRCSA